MHSSDWVALVAALLLGTLAVVRTSAALRGRNRPLWIAHVLIVISLLLAVTPIYSVVDGALGNGNVANLLSHLLFGLVFCFGCQHVALGAGRPDLASLIASKKSWLILGGLSGLIIWTFFLADVDTSSMGLNAFRGEWPVAAYKAFSFAYPMLCSLLLVGPLYREANSYVVPGIQRIAMWFLCVGFSLVIPVPFMHAAEFWLPALRGWVDLLLYTAILLVALGPLIAFLEVRRYKPSKKKTLAR